MEPKLMPRDLKLVIILFIVFGSLSAIDTAIDIIVSLLNSHLKLVFNFGILQIPIGFGLLGLKYRWHRRAIIYLKVVIGLGILIFFIGCIFFILDRPFNLQIFGQVVQMLKSRVGESPEIVISFVAGIIISTLWMILMFWMYRVLTKPSIQELFDADNFADSGIVSLNLRDG
jgi:hypothetical protein